MKKTVLFLGLLLGLAGAAQAQARFGLKMGASVTGLVGDNVSASAKYTVGFHAGIIANFASSDAFSVQPELLFSQKGYKVESAGKTLNYNLNYIDVPVMFRFNVTKLTLEIGPQLGLLASASVSNGTQSVTISNTFSQADFGYALGLGLPLTDDLQLGLRYNGGITSAFKPVVVGGNSIDVKARNSAFQFFVAYMFGSK